LTIDVIEECYEQGVVPELGKWYTKILITQPSDVTSPPGDSLVDTRSSANVDLWCYCQQPESDREMVGCDYPDCSIQ